MYDSESSEPKSRKESESVRVAPQLLEMIISVFDRVRLVFGGVRGSVQIGGDTGFYFQHLLIGVTPDSTSDCLKGASDISSGIGLTVVWDDLQPGEFRCFLCFQDDLYFLIFRWVFSLSSSSMSRKCFLLGI
jgi:hypothetical protein